MTPWILSLVLAVSTFTTFVSADSTPSCDATQKCPETLPCCSRIPPLSKSKLTCRIRRVWYAFCRERHMLTFSRNWEWLFGRLWSSILVFHRLMHACTGMSKQKLHFHQYFAFHGRVQHVPWRHIRRLDVQWLSSSIRRERSFNYACQ